MNGTGFLTACIVALAGVSASLTPFAERAKNQDMKKPDSGVQSEIGPFCFEMAGLLQLHPKRTLSSRRDIDAAHRLVNNISPKRAMRPAVKRKRHREILALITAPRDCHALLTILRKGTRGRHDEEQKGK